MTGEIFIIEAIGGERLDFYDGCCFSTITEAQDELSAIISIGPEKLDPCAYRIIRFVRETEISMHSWTPCEYSEGHEQRLTEQGVIEIRPLSSRV